jgi:hypothetical protein
MNIFYLHNDPEICAAYHCDKHVVKMILEYAQLLSTAHHELDGVPSIECYKSTHKNHPSAVWARQSMHHYRWLYRLLSHTCREYTKRYNKIHATERKGIVCNLMQLPYELRSVGWEDPPQCMPDEYKNINVIKAYRNYYIRDKGRFATWKNGSPFWWQQQSCQVV